MERSWELGASLGGSLRPENPVKLSISAGPQMYARAVDCAVAYTCRLCEHSCINSGTLHGFSRVSWGPVGQAFWTGIAPNLAEDRSRGCPFQARNPQLSCGIRLSQPWPNHLLVPVCTKAIVKIAITRKWLR